MDDARALTREDVEPYMHTGTFNLVGPHEREMSVLDHMRAGGPANFDVVSARLVEIGRATIPAALVSLSPSRSWLAYFLDLFRVPVDQPVGVGNGGYADPKFNTLLWNVCAEPYGLGKRFRGDCVAELVDRGARVDAVARRAGARTSLIDVMESGAARLGAGASTADAREAVFALMRGEGSDTRAWCASVRLALAWDDPSRPDRAWMRPLRAYPQFRALRHATRRRLPPDLERMVGEFLGLGLRPRWRRCGGPRPLRRAEIERMRAARRA